MCLLGSEVDSEQHLALTDVHDMSLQQPMDRTDLESVLSAGG